MSKRPTITKNFKLRVSPQEAEAVQTVCFQHGIYWWGLQNQKIPNDIGYLFIMPRHLEGLSGVIHYEKTKNLWSNQELEDGGRYKNDDSLTKITPSAFIRRFAPKGWCYEMGEGVVCGKHEPRDTEKWEKVPDKYTKGESWYTEDRCEYRGEGYTIEEMKQRSREINSLISSHRRKFPPAK